jgi:histidinol dehydrogenase
VNRFEWSTLDQASRAQVLQRPVQEVSASVREAVSRIREQVAREGDALRALTKQFDGVELDGLEVTEAEFATAQAAVSDSLRDAMREAAGRIATFHRAGMPAPYVVETAPGVVCERIQRPITRVGLYVPAGSAPLPSTALMLTIPGGLPG